MQKARGKKESGAENNAGKSLGQKLQK